MKPLNDRQKKVLSYYIENECSRQEAYAKIYDCKNTRTAISAANRMFNLPAAKLYLEQTTKATIEKTRQIEAKALDAVEVAGEILTKATIERVERETGASDMIYQMLVGMMSANPSEMVDDEGKLLPFNQWPLNLARQVESIDMTLDESGSIAKMRVKLTGIAKLTELLGKHAKVNTWSPPAQKSLSDLKAMYTKKLDEDGEVIKQTVVDVLEDLDI